MARPRSQTYDITRIAWFKLPKDKRSALAVRKALKGVVDPIPGRGTINRWARDWNKVVEDTTERFLPKPPAEAKPEDLAGIPQVLLDALSPRLLYLGRGEGYDRCADAVAVLAAEIRARARQIADMLVSPDEDIRKGGMNAVAALDQLTASQKTLTSSQVMLSAAHRNFGEGDHLSAQASVVLETGRADRAKDITPGQGRSSNGLSAEEEAMAALRATVITPPKK